MLRYFLINYIALWSTTEIIQGLSYTGGIRTLLIGAVVFMGINILLVPLLKVLLLPLNLLTLGVFAWVTNVLALYALTILVPEFRLMAFMFSGFSYGGFTLPGIQLSAMWVAIVASFAIGLITHFLHWLMH